LTSDPSRNWCLSFAAIVVLVACAIVAVNYSVDFYGLFRDPHGKKIKIYANERTSKYLFSYRYIPANFDGIMIGSSLSRTWDVSRIDRARVYNASIAGGNISEEKLIADNVFARGQIKLAIFCIHPYLTATHGRKSEYMAPREYWGALGSIGLVRVYVKVLGSRFDLTKDRYNEYGVNDEFEVDDLAELNRQATASKSIIVDDVAFAEYAQLLKTARSRGAEVVAFIPPMSSVRYEAQKAEYDAYFARIAALFRSDEKIIDLNAPAYAPYTHDAANFYDGAHLTSAAASFFSDELARALRPGAGSGGVSKL
jgi:hypothetical protein